MFKKNYNLHPASIILGTAFLISGWLKGVDPYGTSLQLEEYFRVFGWGGFVAGCSMAWSVCLCAGELCLGLLLLSEVFRKAAACVAVAVMAAFTVLTGWLAFSPMGAAMQDCGCFGEAFTLSHGETFLKNVALSALAVWNLWTVRAECWRDMKGWRTAACCAVLSLGIPLYSAIWLPPVDFLPYNGGTDLGGHPEFAVFDSRYNEVTDSLVRLSEGRPLVVVAAREEPGTDDRKKLETLEALAGQGEISLCLLATPDVEGTGFPEVFYTDEVTLKSLLRAEKGIVVVEDGTIHAKWNLKVYPSFLIDNAAALQRFVAWNSWTALWYALCLPAGLFFIGWMRRKEYNSTDKPE